MSRIFLTIVVAALAAGPARAQFYDLDGAYHCVTTPDAACAKADTDRSAAAPPMVRDPEPAPPSIAEAIERVKKSAAKPEDIRLLESRAEAKDPRAIEVLAWCNLNGIGVARNALASFWLYREAAGLGVANARQNQIAVFERRLTSAERQQVLLKENAR